MLDQRRVVGPLTNRVVDIPHDRVDGARRRAQRIEPGFLKANLVIVNVTDEPVQRSGNGNTPIYVRHVCAAMQRVTGTVQFVGDIERRFVPLAGVEVVRDDLEVTRRLLRKDVVEYRVHLQRHFLFCRRVARRLADGQHRRIWIAFGKCVCLRNQQRDISSRASADFQLLNKFGDGGRGLHDKINHRWRAFERAVDQPVQQVLDSPRILTDTLCPHHAPAALERME